MSLENDFNACIFSLHACFHITLISYAVYKRRFKALGLAAIMGLVIDVPWDTISAGIFQTWFWNEEQLIGVWIGWLPLEEYLFMVLVPMMLIGGALVFQIDLYICNYKEQHNAKS